jgi:NAD(P)-dependent dehydrogenase (short-subunit alcohol dehydrogenase family)
MKSFENKIAVITGGGTGMGRELVLQLARANCNVSMCDVIEENMDQTMDLAASINPNVKITKHVCDVSIKDQVEKFRDDVLSEQQSDSINLLFNNAGIGGGQSFIKSDIEEWEKVFAVCWYGVYFCSRAFMEALIKSDEGHLINTSSVNGFWASLGDGVPHTSYSAAKFLEIPSCFPRPKADIP